MTREESLERDLRRALDRPRATPCPGEGSLFAFYQGRLSQDEGESIREHLAVCAACVEIARDARRFLEAMETVPQASRPPRVGWLAAAAAVLVAVFAGLWILRQRPAAPAPAAARVETPGLANPWRDLPVKAAAYRPSSPEDELVFRSGDEPGAGGFADAMDPYMRGDYAAADTRLARFLERHRGHAEASFYRGVSLLMLGRPEEARALLAAAAAATPPPPEARWYLALALLKSGDAAAALGPLDDFSRAPGSHQAEAVRLSAEIRRARDRR